MKNLLSIFLIMSIVFCGMAYANDYDVNSIGNAIGISELQGKEYFVFSSGQVPITTVGTMRFGESGSFKFSFFHLPEDYVESHSGDYTQTGSTFTAHCEYNYAGITPGEADFEGTSILDIFIFGNSTSRFWDETDGVEGFFFGILSIFL